MPSLTPQNRSEEATKIAFKDGLINGAVTLVPSSFAVWTAMSKSPRFAKATNWQSRTALAIMPALFVFGWTSERKLEHKMKEMAEESENSVAYQELAKKQRGEHLEKARASIRQSLASDETESSVNELYLKAAGMDRVRIVPGDKLAYHQQFANFWQENPFKMLVGLSVPTVLYIFKGKAAKQHLPLQLKLMHTRVYGQFVVIGMLLTLMGFKGYMDSEGKFITESEAMERIHEIDMARELLLRNVAHDREVDEERAKIIERAHDAHERAAQDMVASRKKQHKLASIDIRGVDEGHIHKQH